MTNISSSGITTLGIVTTTQISVSGVVTATTFVGSLTGTATTVTNIPNLSGDVSSVNTVTTLATVNSNIGTYGDVGAIPRVTVNAKGLVTGVTTVAPNNGTLTLAVSGTGLSGSSTFTANQSESSTFTVTSNATSANTNDTLVSRNSSGGFAAGIITATDGFVGALTGNVTGTATTATNAVQFQTARTISLTGDVAGSVSFNGTANVSLAATIQPNSVALGSDTTGDYVTNITGTSNQITVTSGTGEGSTPTLSIPNQFTIPQDVTVTRDLQVTRNLNVTGNVTIGGTSATIFAQELKVFDPDLVIGFRTDALGNDVSNDTTADHGGIAIASTEGTPLLNLFIAGIETSPSTYKKIMWFKSGTFSGLGTDAWLMNYAVGIGSTQFPSGTRLAAGNVQFTQNDLAVVRNINASGVTTSTEGFVGALTGNVTGNVTGNLVGNVNSSGVSTFVSLRSTNINASGIVTANTFSGSGASLTGVPVSTGISGLGANVATFLSTPTSTNLISAVSDETGSGSLVFSTNPTLVTPTLGNATATSIASTSLNVSGVGTISNIRGTNSSITGVSTALDFNATSDINLKTNIVSITNSIEKIVKINGVSFNWKETQKPSIGVIAQDVEKVFPELVSDGDTKTVNYNGLIGALIEAVKEQQKQIDSLKEEIENLKK